MTDVDRIIAAIEALPARIAAELARVLERRHPAALARDAADRELCGLIADATRGNAMTLRKVYAIAELNNPHSTALRAALSSMDPLRLGQRLARLRERGVVGYRITAQKGARAGVAWSVTRCDVEHVNTAPLAEPRRVEPNSTRG